MTARLGAIAAGLLLIAAQADAATPPAPLWGYIGLATPIETGADVQLFADARMTVQQVLQELAQQGQGRVVEIGFTHKDATGWYTALVTTPSGLRHLRIDPASGTITHGDQPDVASTAINPPGRNDLATLNSAPVDLSQAVDAAAKTSGGRVICAGVEQLAGIPVYYVQTVANNGLSEWSVDPTTGRVTKPG